MRLVAMMIVALLALAPAAQAQELAPEFAESYTFDDLGPAPGVPAPLGGLTLKAGTTDRLLIGGLANEPGGALYEIGLARDNDGHITGFTDEATRYAAAAFNDGGVTYGPDGVLFLARWPANELGQTRPGSLTTDKIVDMSTFEVAPSLAALQFVPPGQPGERSLKLSSWEGGEWYDADVAPDGEGMFDVTRMTAVPESRLPGGPEGFVYVAAGSLQFHGPSLLVSEYSAGNVAAYEVDANGDPIVRTRRDFIVGLEGAEGAFIDPVTGDFLFSTFGGGDHVIVVRGFTKPTSLDVRTSVINDGAGNLAAEDFTVHVKEGETDVLGSPQPGSESGALYPVEEAKTYTVSVDPVEHYEVSFGGDCNADGTVVVPEGVQPVCTITATDEEPTARLKVISRVENDEAGAWFAEDFTVHVTSTGGEVTGSPQPGSEEGTEYALFAGSYTVSEDAARGYVGTIGGDCDAKGNVTLADEQTKTCTIINRGVPVGEDLVVESYGPSRTESEWGLTESYLTETRGYLQDPASFGPNGTVAGALQLAPGIRVANARTLAGVDVFFTGWVPTNTYTDAEKAALRDFVLGGGTLIATTDDSSHTMVDAFGLTQGDGRGNPTENTITDAGHPIASGPFGAVTAFNQYHATGHYPALGPDAHEVGENNAGTTLAVIEREELGPGSGAAIFVADVDVFSNFGGSALNATLIKNVFAFATGQRAQPALTIGDATGGEGDSGSSTLTFTVALSAPGTDTVGVHFATTDDTAGAPLDYVAAGGDLEFAPGETAKQVSITVNGDTTVEGDERFRVNLSNASGARLADSQGVGTIANDDIFVLPSPPPNDPPPPDDLPPPNAGKSVNAVPKSGTVKIKVKGTNKFVELDEGQQIPVGSVIDTRKGRVTLVAASNKSGGTATADFFDGIFKVGQTKGAKPITTLDLVEKLSCPRGQATAAARRKKRRLWGDGSGRFRTAGEFSSATVRGTKWLVEDRCDSTLTKVTRGKVEVRDLVKRKTVIVRAGKQYVAKRRR